MSTRRVLDDLDRQIMACLEESGRESNTAIAATLGVSESTVRKRIERLVTEDVLRIKAVANPLKLDYVIAIFLIRALPNLAASVNDQLRSLPELRFIALTSGPYDFIAEGWFTSLDDLRDFLVTRLLSIEGVAAVDTAHILDMVRDAFRGVSPDGISQVPDEAGDPGEAAEDVA